MANPRGQQRDKPFRDALRIEIAAAGEDNKALREIAKQLIAKASSGDLMAVREIADRLDGKPAQAIEHSGEVTRYVVRMPERSKDMAEWQKRHAPKETTIQ